MMFEAYVTSLGLYPEHGVEVGEYLKFPTTTEEVPALFKRIELDGKRYEEYFITGYTVSCIVSFPTFINASEIYDSIPTSITLVKVGPRPKNIQRPYINASFDYGQIATGIVDYVTYRGYKKAAIFIDSVRFSSQFTCASAQAVTKQYFGFNSWFFQSNNGYTRL